MFGCAGCNGGGAEYDFGDQPVARFGGYFAMNHDGPSGIDVTFLDSSGATVATDVIPLAGGGCQARITTSEMSGCPLSGADDYDVLVSGAETLKHGIVFYAYLTASIPFSSGSLCLKPPLKRSWPQYTGAGDPCTGSLAQRINSPAVLNHPAGTVVYFQAWIRDPASAVTTDLSDAIEVTYQ